MKHDLIQTFKILGLALVLSFGVSYVYAWTKPTVAPLGGNTSAPINTGATDQSKEGNLAVGSTNLPAITLDVTGNLSAGNAFFTGDVNAVGKVCDKTGCIGSNSGGGSATETDPTVLESVKNGVSWTEVTGIPPGFLDNTDNIGTLNVITVTKRVNGWGNISATVNCPATYTVVGGGGKPLFTNSTIVSSYPNGNNGWYAEALNNASNSITTYAICARIR